MNPGGLVLMTFAVIGIAQLFAGNVLERLKILPSTAGQTPASSSSQSAPSPITPEFGVTPFGDHGGATPPSQMPQAI